MLSLVGDILRVCVEKLTFVVFYEKIESTGSVATALGAWVSSDSDDSDSIELSKLIVLELLRDRPRDQVTRWTQASFKLFGDRLLAYFTFEANLNRDKNIW